MPRNCSHHLHRHGDALSCTSALRRSSGQCSPGVFALAMVGQPQPSAARSRTGCSSSGLPQYDTPRRTTRIGQVSQIAARAGQFSSTGNVPRFLNRDFAALAAAMLNRFHVDPAQQAVKTLIRNSYRSFKDGKLSWMPLPLAASQMQTRSDSARAWICDATSGGCTAS